MYPLHEINLLSPALHMYVSYRQETKLFCKEIRTSKHSWVFLQYHIHYTRMNSQKNLYTLKYVSRKLSLCPYSTIISTWGGTYFLQDFHAMDTKMTSTFVPSIKKNQLSYLTLVKDQTLLLWLSICCCTLIDNYDNLVDFTNIK